MHYLKTILTPFIICFFAVSCNNSFDSIDKYNQWINNPENGLVKEKKVNGLTLRVKFIPKDVLVYRELQSLTVSKKELDSISKFYDHSLTFQLTIDVDSSSGTKGDIMYYGVSNKEEFKQQAHLLNFYSDEDVSLTTSDNTIYQPVLSNMENTYSMTSGRTFTFVFVPKDSTDHNLKSSKELIFSYNGQLFDLGENHFRYSRKTFNNIPKLNFKTNAL